MEQNKEAVEIKPEEEVDALTLYFLSNKTIHVERPYVIKRWYWEDGTYSEWKEYY